MVLILSGSVLNKYYIFTYEVISSFFYIFSKLKQFFLLKIISDMSELELVRPASDLASSFVLEPYIGGIKASKHSSEFVFQIFNFLRFFNLERFAFSQIALLQRESEIPIEELIARYKKVGWRSFCM